MNLYQNLATITVHTHQLPHGRYYKTYEWNGKSYQLVRLGLFDTHNDPIINYFKLKLVKEDDWGIGYNWYARTDSIWLYWSWLLWLQNKFYEKGMWVKVRIILTLEIWGVGYTEHGSIYEWKNIFRKRNY